MRVFIKIALSIALFSCLLNMPYGYYQLVRFVTLIGFGVLAYKANQEKKETEMMIFIILALLFQPFFKIALGRTLWNVVDIVVGGYLLISLLKKDYKNYG